MKLSEAQLLHEVSGHYAVPFSKLELIRHNENRTYCLDGAYLLRVHESKEGFRSLHPAKTADSVKIHESELRFIEHLKSCGIPVQTPMRTVEHRFVSVLSDGTPVTLLTWLPGRTVEKADLTEEFGYALGRMIADLHRAAGGYQAEHSNRYDTTLCEQLAAQFCTWDHGEIEGTSYNTMERTLAAIGERLRETEPEHILLHSDLSLSNLLITDRGLVPIDFSLLGYSDPLLDFGSVFCFTKDPACRDGAVRGYEQAMGCHVDQRKIEVYTAFQILLGIALHHDLWVKEEWYAKRLPQWCEENFLPLVEG